MSPREPDFDQLIGSDVEPAERERLRRVHELLVAAGPPPDLPGSLASAPAADPARLAPRRRGRALLALAAALGVAVFAVGVVVGDRGEPTTDFVVAMSGASGATASLDVFEVDAAGNWPMELEVEGLEPAPGGRLYQLWLTRDGAPTVLCGSFLTEQDGTAVVPMNAPWRLDEFDGWVVVEEGSTTPLLATT
jgi:hypothetical protein